MDQAERIDRRLDARGLLCPEPIVRVRRELHSMCVGECLEILADDPLAEIDLRIFCERFGHELLGPEPFRNAQRFWIRTGLGH